MKKEIEKFVNNEIKLANKMWKPTISSRLNSFFDKLMTYFIILAFIIFNPVTLIIGGLITIILILIL